MDNGAQSTPLHLTVQIAGIPTGLTFRGLSASARNQICEWYGPFCVSDTTDTPKVEIDVEPGELFVPFVPNQPWQIETQLAGDRIEFSSHYEKGWFDLKQKQGRLVLRPEGSPENFLRVLYAWRCLERGALLLHASGMIRNGRGYVFIGHSGSGKTTISRLSTETQLLSDDLVIVRCEPVEGRPGAQVYGVPFRGDMVEGPRINANAPLHGLYALIKDHDHSVENISRHEAAGRLASCVPFIMTQPKEARRVLQICSELTGRVPFQSLHFRRDPGFWDLLDG